MLTQQQIGDGLRALGAMSGMMLEVHTSLSSFGPVEGGAETVIRALKKCCGPEGSIFMPALRLGREQQLTERDRALGITTKIPILPENCERSAMGLIADTFRRQPDTWVGTGVFRIAGWGLHGKEAVEDGLEYPLRRGGKGLLLGVDIYKLTAMHYVEEDLPEEIRHIFAPSEEARALYPAEKWFIEGGKPPVKPWYTVQRLAMEQGKIKTGETGACKAMLFDLWDVVGLYQQLLRQCPYQLYGLQPWEKVKEPDCC